jgi:hypothetical protein
MQPHPRAAPCTPAPVPAVRHLGPCAHTPGAATPPQPAQSPATRRSAPSTGNRHRTDDAGAAAPVPLSNPSTGLPAHATARIPSAREKSGSHDERAHAPARPRARSRSTRPMPAIKRGGASTSAVSFRRHSTPAIQHVSRAATTFSRGDCHERPRKHGLPVPRLPRRHVHLRPPFQF